MPFPIFLRFRCSPQMQMFHPMPLSPSFCRAISLSAANGKGHSHYQNTKDIKAKNDLIKSQALNELLLRMKKAVKDGFDPKKNKKLQDIMDDMKKKSLPLDKFRNHLEKLKNNDENSKNSEKS